MVASSHNQTDASSYPMITVGLTAYNSAATIERAVVSALNQTWRPIEIVAIDDCSTDNTASIISRIADSHPELRMFRNHKNLGVAATRNRVLAEAKGAFIAFFDDDDESLPQRLSIQLRRILDYERNFANGAPVVCHTARRQYYPNGLDRIVSTMGQNERRSAPTGLPVAERILLGTPLLDGYGACATCSQMGRVAIYRDLGGFDPTFRRSEDTEFNIRLAKAGGHFVGVASPQVSQTMTNGSEKRLAEEYRNTLALMDKHRDVMDRKGQYKFCRRMVDAKQAWLEGRSVDFVIRLAGLAARHPFIAVRRLALAVPNLRLNRAIGRFHNQPEG